jgi:membrane associated rhomboid family serine protease
MLPIYTTDTKTTTISTTSSSPSTLHSPSSANPTRHARKLSHIQFNKRAYQDDYASSTFMIPFDESPLKTSIRALEEAKPFPSNQSIAKESLLSKSKKQRKYCRHWLFSSDYWGPFSKGEHWPLFTYIMMAFTVLVFSGELLMSKQSSGEFFELEPFNYMLGPSIEIMVQVGARFPPCMRHIESMPPDEHYVCLNTIAEKSKAPAMVSNQTKSLGGGESLLLLDPVLDLADPRLMNSSCSLSSICGIAAFHQSHVPDQTFRFLTPLFIHTGLIHLAINLSVLVLFGAKVERVMNPLRFSSKFFYYYYCLMNIHT